MRFSSRLATLAMLAAFIVIPVSGWAEDGDRTAGRKAGDPVPAATAAPLEADDIEAEPLDEPAAEKPKAEKPAPKKALPPENKKPEKKAEAEESKPALKDTPSEEPADEEDSVETKEPAEPVGDAKILKADYPALESRGLYYSPADGSLGRDLWTNTKRSVLLNYLPSLPSAGKSPFLQTLTTGLLLSDANAKLIENDVPPKPGEDMLTHRLMKLMDLGMSDQALKIYSDMGQPPYHPNLAQAGIIALLFNAEKSLACLEYKTFEDRDFSGKFWTDIGAYCDFTLEGKKADEATLDSIHSSAIKRIAGGGKFAFNYNAQQLAEMPLLDRAILTAENLINFGGFSLETVRRIAPAHLTLAMKKPKLARQDEFLLTMKMVQYGLKNKAEWEKTYASFKFNGPADEQKFITIESLPGWQQLPALYQNAKTAEKESPKGSQAKSYALQALGYAATYGPAAVYPFADMLTQVSPDNLSTTQFIQIAEILQGADRDIPASWFPVLAKRKPTGEKDMALFVLAYVAKAYLRPEAGDHDAVAKSVDAINNSHLKETFKIIIENVDKPLGDQHNDGKVYENDADLTFSGNYVMPSKRVWDLLKASSQNQSIGETVLLSALLLNDKHLTDLYPGVLSDVLSSLRAVGLTRSSKSLAQQALLEKL